MHRRTLAQLLGLAALHPAAVWRSAQAQADGAPPLPALGTALALPEEVPLLGGGRFRAAQAQGQVLVIYWWASWCPFCALQTPSVQKLWETQRARGLQVLALSIDRQSEDASRYLRQRGYTFPSGMHSAEVERVLPKPSKALPVTLVLDRQGRVVMAEGGQLFPEDVEQIARFL